MRKILLLAMALELLVGGLIVGVKNGYADDLDNVLATYGRPDSSDSTQFDNPRPMIITKWLIYNKQGVRFTFLLDSGKWKLFGLQDSVSLKPLTADEVQRRFRK
jgi:hypothetical protein